MRFTYNNKLYAIWFEHHTDKGTVGMPKPRYTGCTIAEILGPKDAQELVTEDAFCADCDNFSKAIGRKIALGRALCRLTSDKTFRRTAWMAYLSRGGGKPRVIDISVTQVVKLLPEATREAKPLAQVVLESKGMGI